MDPFNFALTTLSGFISGALVAALPLWKNRTHAHRPARKTPSEYRSVHIDRSQAVAVDQSQTITYEVNLTPQAGSRPERGTSGSARPRREDDEFTLAAVGALIAAMLFLLVWPYALGLLGGVTATAALSHTYFSLRLTELAAVRRAGMILHAAVSAGTTSVSCFVILAPPPSVQGMADIEKAVAAELPRFGDSFVDRILVLSTEVLTLIAVVGLQGFTTLVLLFGSFAFAAISASLLMMRSISAWALYRQARGKTLSVRQSQQVTGMLTTRSLADFGFASALAVGTGVMGWAAIAWVA